MRWEGEALADLTTHLDGLVRRYRGDPAIDFAQASLAQGLAWCIARFSAADLLQKQRRER